MKKNIAVIGCGYWGKNLVRNFYELSALHTICDVDENMLKSFQNKYPDLAISDDYKSLLNNPEIKAVVISTPAVTHYKFAKQALIADKDVFVEKPIALHYEEGEELVSLAQQKDKILMVGHVLEYHPAVVKLKDLVRSGDLGKINYIYSNRLNLGKFRTEENILWSFAPHDISIILSLLQEMPSSISAYGGEYLNKGIVDVTTTNMSFPSGANAHIFVSWLHPFKEQKLVVVGNKKMAVFDDTASEEKLLIYDHEIEWIDRVPIPRKHDSYSIPLEKKEPLKEECRHFLECVDTRKSPLTGSQNGLNVLRVLEMSQQSLSNNGKTITFKQVEDNKYFIHEKAVIDDNVKIGEGTKIWHFSHVQSGARIGRNCILGQNVNIGNNVTIGNFVKIQNNVSVYEGVTLEDYVFCGPSIVFTNITNPRSKYPQVGAKYYKKTLVREGASLGANSTIICGNTIGRFALVGAGAVVTKDIPDFALVTGNPARISGWMSEAGQKLDFDANGIAVCKKSGKSYRLNKNRVEEIQT